MAFTEFTNGTVANAIEVNDNFESLRDAIDSSTTSISFLQFPNSAGTVISIDYEVALDLRGASGVYKTTNGGTTWTQISTANVGTTIWDVNYKDSDYILTSSHVTNDGGATWNTWTGTGTGDQWYTVTDSGRIYAICRVTGPGTEIQQTDNNGSTWTTTKVLASDPQDNSFIRAPTDDIIFSCHESNNDHVYVHWTDDGFSTQQTADFSNTSFAVNACTYIDEDNYLYDVRVGDNGFYVRNLDGTQTVDLNDSFVNDNDTNVYRVYVRWTPEFYVLASVDRDSRNNTSCQHRRFSNNQVTYQPANTTIDATGYMATRLTPKGINICAEHDDFIGTEPVPNLFFWMLKEDEY